MAGDSLYLQKCEGNYRYLQLSDIQKNGPAQIFGDQYILNCSNPMTGLIDASVEVTSPFFSLNEAISTMENIHLWKYGILTVADDLNGASVLICVKQGNYYIFDSHSRDVYGNVVENGTSVLLHLKSKDAFVKYIKNIACQLCASQFEITQLAPITLGMHRMLQTTTKSSQVSKILMMKDLHKITENQIVVQLQLSKSQKSRSKE